MRSLRDWIAGAPTASLAAALGFVVVGAGLFGFAIAELTSGDGGGDASAPAQAPAVVGGSTQPGGVPTWPADLSVYTVVIAGAPDRPSALAAARKARRAGLDAGIIEAARHGLAGRGGMGEWLVYTGTFAERAGAVDLMKRLSVVYRGARAELVQSSQ
jgi:hypothetical protein